MKKIIGIKIIKHKDIAILSAVIHKIVDPERATVCKKTNREIAGRVTHWVNERREHQRVEENRNICRFFGKPSVLPIAI